MVGDSELETSSFIMGQHHLVFPIKYLMAYSNDLRCNNNFC